MFTSCVQLPCLSHRQATFQIDTNSTLIDCLHNQFWIGQHHYLLAIILLLFGSHTRTFILYFIDFNWQWSCWQYLFMRDTHSIRFTSIKVMLLWADVIVCQAGNMWKHKLPLNGKQRFLANSCQTIYHHAYMLKENISATHWDAAPQSTLVDEAIFA